ncbi:MAG: hypothetical protein U1A78_24560 [Polyangia bacterium]
MRVFTQLGRALGAGVLLAVLGTPGAVRAEGGLSALAEMRAAAEALADVEPDGVRPARPEGPAVQGARSGEPGAAERSPASGKASGIARAELARAERASGSAALHAAIRSAVRDEVTREVQALERAPRAAAPGRAASPGEPARGEAERASDAARQAQQARLNRAVGQSHGMGPGRSNKPLITLPPAAAGAGR